MRFDLIYYWELSYVKRALRDKYLSYNSEDLLRDMLVRDDLDVGVARIVGEHDGDAVGKRQVVPGEGGALAVFVGPDRAYFGPDFLAALVFAGGLAVVDEVSRGVGHMLPV